MSHQSDENYGKLQKVADFEKAAIDLERLLNNVNKPFLRKIFNGFENLANALERKEPGIFNSVIKWFRLYLSAQISVDPSNEKLLKLFEKTIPTAISYIIGCLQHKSKETPNYHSSLLSIIEEILENAKPHVITQIVNFETGTIASLWNPIDYAADFNTQLKTLRILALFLKHFDSEKLNEELKTIKWTNLNLFQDKLKTIVQETKLVNIFENTARELLNNYNMNLSKNVMVYSFYCQSLVFGKKFNFYQPLNMEKFWIDINYGPKSLSFTGRFKLSPKSKFENISVIVKVHTIKLDNNNLLIHFTQAEYSKIIKPLSTISEKVVQLVLPQEEENRLKENKFILDYFSEENNRNISNEQNDKIKIVPPKKSSKIVQKIRNTSVASSPNVEQGQNTFNVDDPKVELNRPKIATSSSNVNHEQGNAIEAVDPLEINHSKDCHGHSNKTDAIDPLEVNHLKDWNESPKTSLPKNHNLDKHPIRNLRTKRRHFFSHFEDIESDEETKKVSKRKLRAKKNRLTNPHKKQIGKVFPMVDLTHITQTQNNENESTSRGEIVDITNEISNNYLESPIPTATTTNRLTPQQCSRILKKVSEVYKVADSTYAEPCQSYRNFKTQPIPRLAQTAIDKKSSVTKGRKKKVDNAKNEVAKKSVGYRKDNRGSISSNKENISPCTSNAIQNIKGKTSYSSKKRILSQNLFGSQTSNEAPPPKKLRPTENQNLTTYSANIEIDLTLDDDTKRSKEQRPKTLPRDIFDDLRTGENAITTESPNCTPNSYGNIRTPKSPNSMNISDINDSDMDLTQLPTSSNIKMLGKYRNENLKTNTVEEILNDWDTNSEHNEKAHEAIDDIQLNLADILKDSSTNDDEIEPIRGMEDKDHEFNANSQTIFKDIEPIYDLKNPVEDLPSNSKHLEMDILDKNSHLGESLVYRRRHDSEDSDSSDNSDDGGENVIKPSVNCLKKPNLIINEDIVVMHNMPTYFNRNPNTKQDPIWNTPDKKCMIVRNVSTKTTTKCQVTPNTIITRHIQVNTKEAVLVANTTKPIKQYQNLKAKKDLNILYNKVNTGGNTAQVSKKDMSQNIGATNENLGIENNNTIVPFKHIANNDATTDSQNRMNNTIMHFPNLKKAHQIHSNQQLYQKNQMHFLPSASKKDHHNETANASIPRKNINLRTPNANRPIENRQKQIVPLVMEQVKANNLNISMEAEEISTALMPFKNNNLISTTNDNNLNKINENHRLSFLLSSTENAEDISFEPPTSSTFSNINLINQNSNENITLENVSQMLPENPLTYHRNTETIYVNSETNTEESLNSYENNLLDVMENSNSNDFDINTERRISQHDESTLYETLKYGEDIFENDLSKLVSDYNAQIQIRLENARRQCLTNKANLYRTKMCEITESILEKSEEQEKELKILRSNIERLVTQMEWQYEIFIKKSKQYDNYKEIMERTLDALDELNIKNCLQGEYNNLIKQLNADKSEVIQEVWQDYVEERKSKFLSSIDKLSKI